MIIRAGPAASRWRGWALCGSHFTHSHSAMASGVATTAIRASAGLCHITYCATMARASPRAAPIAPACGSSQTVALSLSDSATGRSGTTAWAMRKRRSASAVTGSIASGGPVAGATRRLASRCAPLTDAHVPEIGVDRGPLPEPASGQHRRPGVRLGMHGLRGAALQGRHLPRAAAHLAEVAQVVAPPLVEGRRARRAAPPASTGGHHAERRDRKHAPEQPRRRVVDTEHNDEAQGPDQHHQRQQAGEDPRGNQLLRLRWRLQRQLAAGGRRRLTAWPRDRERAHEFLQTAPWEGPRRRC